MQLSSDVSIILSLSPRVTNDTQWTNHTQPPPPPSIQSIYAPYFSFTRVGKYKNTFINKPGYLIAVYVDWRLDHFETLITIRNWVSGWWKPNDNPNRFSLYFMSLSVSKSLYIRLSEVWREARVYLCQCWVTADLISFEVEEFRIILRHEAEPQQRPGQRPSAQVKVKLCS